MAAAAMAEPKGASSPLTDSPRSKAVLRSTKTTTAAPPSKGATFNRDQAANWAIFWRPQIQNYMHAYRAVTGVDLTREDGAMIDAQQPSTHLLRRLKEQNSKIKL